MTLYGVSDFPYDLGVYRLVCLLGRGGPVGDLVGNYHPKCDSTGTEKSK